MLDHEMMDQLIVSSDIAIKQAMQNINLGKGRILFVVNQHKKLIGTVTDGDIRRAILNSIELTSAIKHIMCKSPRFVNISDGKYLEKAKTYITVNNLQYVPILNDDQQIIDVLTWKDFLDDRQTIKIFSQNKSIPVVIMAGGKGTRLDPLTRVFPKPLIPIGNQTIIEVIMNTFSSFGFEKFFISLNYKKTLIKTYFKEIEIPYPVSWIEEDDYLGTAGSLSLLKGKLNGTFFVTNCDVILKSDLNRILEWHKSEKAQITIIGYHREISIPYGIIEISNKRLKKIREKPTYDIFINTGIYVCEPDILDYLQSNQFTDMTTLIDAVSKEKKVSVFPICSGWYDTGEWKEYKMNLNFFEHT